MKSAEKPNGHQTVGLSTLGFDRRRMGFRRILQFAGAEGASAKAQISQAKGRKHSAEGNFGVPLFGTASAIPIFIYILGYFRLNPADYIKNPKGNSSKKKRGYHYGHYKLSDRLT